MTAPRLTFLGHATVRIDLPDGRVALIDPWVEGNPACPEGHKSFDRVDAILVTHGHFDHFADVLPLARQHGPEIVVGTWEICGWLTKKGVENASGMNPGGTQQVLGLEVTQVQAVHSSSIDDGERMIYGGVATGYVIRDPASGFVFYHSGDTCLFSDMKLIAELYQPSLAFLPIGDHFTMGPRQAAHACGYLGIETVVPIHYGTFPMLTGTPEELALELATLGVSCQVRALRPGESLDPST